MAQKPQGPPGLSRLEWEGVSMGGLLEVEAGVGEALRGTLRVSPV